MRKTAIKELTIMAIFVALTAVMAQISIPLPFTPVPISFGLVAVYMCGILLTPKQAILTQICYLLIGAVGLPVFSGFRGGVAVLFGATGGYLMVYPIMAAIVALTLNSSKGIAAEQVQSKWIIFLKSSIAICIAHILLYLGGTIWLCAITKNSFLAGLALAVFPYIPLDIVKIVFCVAAVVPLRLRLRKMNLLMLDKPQSAVV